MGAQDQKDIDLLPREIPVFPLNGVLLLPGGQLPLNIFEKRYLAMVRDALKEERLIGMIQPRGGEDKPGAPALFQVGCAGRITAFEETEDGRYLITLTGICRFRTEAELEPRSGYRRMAIDWQPYAGDTRPESCLDLDRNHLKSLLCDYFQLHSLSCDWDAVDGTPDQKLITSLAMICPLGPNEKQALLEAQCCRSRASMFMTMLEMAVRDKGACGGCH